MQIVTDFKAHNVYMHQNVDAYIVASQYTRDSLIKRGGLQRKNIYLRHSYEARILYQFIACFFENGLLHLLIMGGSMGLRAMRHVIAQLVSLEFSDKLRLSIVCGKNKKLFVKLNQNYQNRIQDQKSYSIEKIVDLGVSLMNS